MESVFAFYDGEKFIAEKKMTFRKGQKVILTVLDEDTQLNNESSIMYDTTVKSESFNYLFAEGEHEYTIDDCKEKLK
ncbi:MAG: hypothetical protein LH478_08150 [Chitinophagaceae bacterium]|nr:hypothetical protein [Chitinophagaceae bacterium]